MNKRIYNVFFSLHTVSGIVISVGLYIIFFTGSFSFFKDEIEVWEKGNQIENRSFKSVDFNKIINHFDEEYGLYGRDFEFKLGETEVVSVNITACKDTLNITEKGKSGAYFFLKTTDLSQKTYAQNYGLSHFLYRLHFLDPIIYPVGRNLAGLIAIFFVFAIVTGIIVHWDKIITNFYNFNPKVFLKRVWTDAHTGLGTLGLPFQFIYGITGAFLIIKVLILIPANFVYNGDQTQLVNDLLPSYKVDKWEKQSKEEPLNLSEFISSKSTYWDDFNIERIRILNYGGENMKYMLIGKQGAKTSFVGLGRLECNAYTGEVIFEKNPNEVTYSEDIVETVYRIHFGNYGGITLKIIYFIFGLLTCFVIITGVLVWIEARNKKSMTLKQRLYTAKVGHIYLAICLSMLPVTAMSFLFTKLTYGIFEEHESSIYWFYFTTWLVFVLFYRFRRDNYFMNKNSLLLGSIFGFLVPLANGIMTGNWFWLSFFNKQYEIFTIDIFWIILSTCSLLFYLKIKPEIKDQSSFSKSPIDYKELKKQKNANKIITPFNLNDNKNFLPMRTKIIVLWILVIFGYIFHHIYGLSELYFKESLLMEGATGIAPMWVHQWRILMEGTAFLFVILSLNFSSKTFKLLSLVWAIVVALFNCYHVVEELLTAPGDISKVFILFLTALASVLLVFNIKKWYNEND